MANTLQIKRTTTSNAPGTLKQGELAYAGGSNVLYIGKPSVEDDVVQLTDSSMIADEDATTGAKIILSEGTDNGSNITALVVPALGASYTLTLPTDITNGQYLHIDSSGNLSFQDSSIAELVAGVDDSGAGAPASGDFLVYDGSTWDHITSDELKDKLGFLTNVTLNDLTVSGDLTVTGATTLDTSQVLIKDKTLALGINGGVLEATITTYDNGTGSAQISCPGLGSVVDGEKRWLDGNGTGFSGVVTNNLVNGTDSIVVDVGAGLGIANGTACYVSANTVSDAAIDGAGIRLIGDTVKEIIWNDNNDEFSISGGSLAISGSKLQIEGMDVIDSSAGTLNTDISVDASQLSGVLDGGEF